MWGERFPGLPLASHRGQQTGPIGIDLHPEGLRVAQWERGHAGLSLRAGAVPHPVSLAQTLKEPRELRGMLREARRAARLRGTQAVSAVPREDVRLMVVNYKTGPRRTDEEQIVDLVQERLRADLSDHVIDFVPIRTSGEKHGEKSALVAAAQRDAVEHYLDLLGGAGLSVSGLEIAPTAICRLLSASHADGRIENFLILDFGLEHTDLMLLWGRRLILFRELDFGEARLLARVGDALQLSEAEAHSVFETYGLETRPGPDADPERALHHSQISETIASILKPEFRGLAQQVRQALSYAASQTHGAEIEHVCLLGRVSHWPGADMPLSELLEWNFQRVDPIAALCGNQDWDTGAAATLAVAAGLGLRGLDGYG